MAQPTKANVRHFMRRQLQLWPDYSDYEGLVDDAGEAQAGKLAEAAAQEFDQDAWLDDPNHWVWDVAVEEAERYEREENPSDRLTVTADDEEEAERKARKFGRVLRTKRIGPNKFVVSVSRRNNPDDGVTEAELTKRLKF